MEATDLAASIERSDLEDRYDELVDLGRQYNGILPPSKASELKQLMAELGIADELYLKDCITCAQLASSIEQKKRIDEAKQLLPEARAKIAAIEKRHKERYSQSATEDREREAELFTARGEFQDLLNIIATGNSYVYRELGELVDPKYFEEHQSVCRDIEQLRERIDACKKTLKFKNKTVEVSVTSDGAGSYAAKRNAPMDEEYYRRLAEFSDSPFERSEAGKELRKILDAKRNLPRLESEIKTLQQIADHLASREMQPTWFRKSW